MTRHPGCTWTARAAVLVVVFGRVAPAAPPQPSATPTRTPSPTPTAVLAGGRPVPTRTLPPGAVELPSPPDRGRSFTGSPVTLNLKDADVRDVAAHLAELAGLSVVIDPEVRGTVTVSLRDVPWDQALDLILTANGLGWVREGKVVRIAPVRKLVRERP